MHIRIQQLLASESDLEARVRLEHGQKLTLNLNLNPDPNPNP